MNKYANLEASEHAHHDPLALVTALVRERDALTADRADIARDLHDVEVKNMVLCERILALEAALRDTLSGNYPTPARYDEIRALVATAETSVCKHGNGENCPECATIRAAHKRLALNRGTEHE